jgi:hypothetical protein
MGYGVKQHVDLFTAIGARPRRIKSVGGGTKNKVIAYPGDPDLIKKLQSSLESVRGHWLGSESQREDVNDLQT